MEENNKQHWEQVYETKNPNEVSWTQLVPQTSLDFIHSFNLAKTDKIIDIGGGDSRLVDYLLQEGFTNVTVLDISAKALAKAQARLGDKSDQVTWIVCDINAFKPAETYTLWHDRAAFHFLTHEDQITNYLNIVSNAVSDYVVIGTFSENGPEKCSGLPIKKYSELQLQNQFHQHFKKIRCITEDHVTPFETTQNFLFCSFKKTESIA
jgi:cyclopropane fatty-acyl-phospholipid synthase-like methyltransferase